MLGEIKLLTTDMKVTTFSVGEFEKMYCSPLGEIVIVRNDMSIEYYALENKNLVKVERSMNTLEKIFNLAKKKKILRSSNYRLNEIGYYAEDFLSLVIDGNERSLDGVSLHIDFLTDEVTISSPRFYDRLNPCYYAEFIENPDRYVFYHNGAEIFTTTKIGFDLHNINDESIAYMQKHEESPRAIRGDVQAYFHNEKLYIEKGKEKYIDKNSKFLDALFYFGIM